MKKVVDIHKKEIVEVPDDYIQCSVCGRWEAPEDFRKPREVSQSRTNCKTCYEMEWDDMQALKESTKQRMNQFDVYKLRKELEAETAMVRNSVPVQEMITFLQSLPENARVCVTQEGYYAEGDYGEIYTGLAHPEDFVGEVDGAPVVSIGHSCQHY